MAVPEPKDIVLAIPFQEKEKAKELAAPGSIEWSEELRVWYFSPSKQCLALPEALYKYLPGHVFEVENKVFLSIPYSQREGVAKFGVRYDRRWKAPYWPGEVSNLPRDLAIFSPPKYSWEAHLNELHGGASGRCKSPSRRIPDPEFARIGSEAARACRDEYPGFLIVGQWGMRRMLATWYAGLAAMNGEPSKALVVCVQADVAAWRQVLDAVGTQRCDVVIVPYDNLRQFYDTESVSAKSLRGLAHFGKPEEFDLIVWDGAHLLRNPTSGRTGLALKMATNARFNVWTSALPAYKMSEMAFLLNLLKVRTSWGNPESIPSEKDLAAWCGKHGFSLVDSEAGRLAWEYPLPESVSNDARKIHSLLFRRDDRGTLAAFSMQRLPDTVVEATIIPQSPWNEAGIRFVDGAPDAFKKLSAMRMDALVEKARSLVSEGMSVVIVSAYSGPFFAEANKLREAYVPFALITDKTQNVEAEKSAFESQKCRIALVQFGSAISFPAPSYRTRFILFAEPPIGRDEMIQQIARFSPTKGRVAIMTAHSGHRAEEPVLAKTNRQMIDGTTDQFARKWRVW